MGGTPVTLSIVIPLYNEEQVLPALYRRLSAALASLGSHEIIFVNDGSRDGTLNLLRRLAEENPSVIVLDLSRNFGHQPALTAGLEAARGEAVIMMDGDLQDPPELIPELVAAWRDGNDVVVARRRSRKETGIRGLLLRGFHRLFSFVSDYPVDPDSGIFGLFSRRALDHLLRLDERNRFLPGLRSWIGFSQSTVWYDRAAREAGTPKQDMRRLMGYAFDAIFSFSYKPLRLIWLLGLVVSAFSFAYAGILLVMRILQINVVLGFTTPTVSILFLGGVQLIMTGILGEYLARIYDEVKRRPHYIVQERIQGATENGSRDELSLTGPSTTQAPPVSTARS